MMAEQVRPVVWQMSEQTLMRMLNRVATGEPPEVVYLEELANSDVEHPDAP